MSVLAERFHALVIAKSFSQEELEQGTIARSASKILCHMSIARERRRAIVQSEAVRAFTRLLSSTSTTLKNYACTTLHNLINDSSSNNREVEELRKSSLEMVRQEQGVLHLARILKRAQESQNRQLTIIVVDSLRLLAVQNQPAKDVLLAEGTMHLVLELLQSSQLLHDTNYKKLLFRSVKFLKVLSASPANYKVEMIKAGVLGILSPYLGYPKEDIVLDCVWTIRNLSDKAARILSNGDSQILGLIPMLIRLLDPKIPIFTSNAVINTVSGALHNLTCDKETKKVAFDNGIIVKLMDLLHDWGNHTHGYPAIQARDLLDEAISILKNVTYGHEKVNRYILLCGKFQRL